MDEWREVGELGRTREASTIECLTIKRRCDSAELVGQNAPSGDSVDALGRAGMGLTLDVSRDSFGGRGMNGKAAFEDDR